MKFDAKHLSDNIVDGYKKEGFSNVVSYAKATGLLAALVCMTLEGDIEYVEGRVKELMAIEPPKGE